MINSHVALNAARSAVVRTMPFKQDSCGFRVQALYVYNFYVSPLID